MLDNFSVEDTRKAVELIGGKFETESSGGITFDTLRDYAECGVDFISVGALTHSVTYIYAYFVSVSAMLVSIHQKNIAQAFILERYFFVSIYPAVIPGTYLMVFLVVALLLCLLHQIYIQRS